MSRLSHCWLVAIVTIACYSACGHTKSTDAGADCGKDVSDEIHFYHSTTVGKVEEVKLSEAKPELVTGATSIIFITHGYLENSYHPSCELVRRAYLPADGKTHVIVVDWSFANKGLLNTARKQMDAVGKAIADLIHKLVPTDFSLITLIGHSLGAHVMGIAGRKLDGKIPMIIGLDPTSTSLIKPQALQLSSSAAKYVQVIHSFSYGDSKALGHVDFYANGPPNKPYCLSGECTHGHAYEYFAESLTSTIEFEAHKCNSDQKPSANCNGDKAKVGGKGTPAATLSGKYHFQTNAESPYIIRKPGPKEDSLTVKILRMRNNMYTSMRNSWQRLFGK